MRLHPNIRFLLAPLALILLVAISYREAPNNTFHFDDEINIVRYPPVLMVELTPGNLLEAGQDAFLPSRPLPSITFAIDWWRGNGSVRSFQYTNIVIHAATAVAVFALLMLVLGRLRRPPWVAGVAAFCGAALWACHPIQVQGVTYIVQRMTSMAALFTILTVILYIVGRDTQKAGRQWIIFILAGLCWMLGLMSKETAAIAPFLVLLAEYGVIRHGQGIVRRALDWALLSIPAVLAVLIVLDIASGAGPLSSSFLSDYDGRDFTLAERLLTQPRVIAFHLSQIIWPLPGRFSLEHDFVLSTGLLTPVSTLFALLAVVCWCALGIWALFRPHIRVVGFFLLWVPATLVIESTFIALEMVFEHRMYLPSVALAGLAAIGVSAVLPRATWLRSVVLAACTIIVGLLIASTSQRVPQWRSQASLAQAAVENAPNSSRAWANLANAMFDEGADQLKIGPPMLKALALDPDNPLAMHLKAIRMVELRRFDEAENLLDRLAPHVRRDNAILNTRGMLHFGRGDFPGAAMQFEKAIVLDPFDPQFRYNLALAYEFSGQCDKAHNKWSTYLLHEPSMETQATVRARIKRVFETEGGHCFGQFQ